MNTSKILGVALILLSLWVGYVGFNTVSANTNKINLLGLKIDASNENGQQKGYMYLGFAVVLFAGGIYVTGKSKQ